MAVYKLRSGKTVEFRPFKVQNDEVMDMSYFSNEIDSLMYHGDTQKALALVRKVTEADEDQRVGIQVIKRNNIWEDEN